MTTIRPTRPTPTRSAATRHRSVVARACRAMGPVSEVAPDRAGGSIPSVIGDPRRQVHRTSPSPPNWIRPPGSAFRLDGAIHAGDSSPAGPTHVQPTGGDSMVVAPLLALALASSPAPDSAHRPIRIARRFEEVVVRAPLHDLRSTETVHLITGEALRRLPIDRLADASAP